MSETLGKLVYKGRKNKNMSMRTLAEYVDMNHTDIMRIEKDIYVPKPDIIRKISRYIDISYQELMDASGYKNNINVNNKYISNLIEGFNDSTIEYGITVFSGVASFEFILKSELEKELDKTKDKKKKELLMDTINDLDYWFYIHSNIRKKLEDTYKQEHFNYITQEDLFKIMKEDGGK